jgi:hypothetical protein
MSARKIASIAIWMLAGAASAAVPDSLTVVVFDFAGVSQKLLLSAANEARRAFRAAGVKTEWIVCDALQGCDVPERFVQMKILSQPLPNTPVSSHGLATTATCTVTEYCAASYVFYDRILTFASTVGSRPDLTLGYAMAHEIGHMLGLGHRPGGIMTASLTSHDLRMAAVGWLNFAQEDARELRAAVSRSQMSGLPERRIKLVASRGITSE